MVNRTGPKLDADRPRVVAFGGGKGGVGRTTICAETARSVAHRGARVLCVDANWSTPTLHTLLHAEPPRFSSSDGVPPLGTPESHVADFIEATGVEGIWWVSLAASRENPYARPRIPPDSIIDQLYALDFDWVFLDLEAGLDPLDVGLFVHADLPLLVATPEPATVRTTTQYLREAMIEAVRAHPDARDHLDTLDELVRDAPLDLSAGDLRAATVDDPLGDVVDEALDQLECYLLVNLVREGAEQDLGYVICHAWYESLDLFPRFLTSIDYENRRWFYHRRTTGRNAVRGDETLSHDIETLADQASDISVVDAKYPRPIPTNEDVHPALRLGISPDSSRNEVRQHCRRLWEGYKRERAVDVIFSDPDARTEIAGELETLYRKVLTLPSDTFDTVHDLDKPPGTNVGLAASSSGTSGAEESESPDRDTGLDEASTPTADESVEASPGLATESSASEPTVSADDAAAETASGAAPTEPEVEEPDGDADANSQVEPESTSPDVGDGVVDDGLPDLAPPDESGPGEVIEKLRRRKSVSLQELSRRTNIGVKFLTAIEDANIDVLPRPVYLREYLRKLSRAFDVDADALVDAYLERLDQQTP